VQAVNVGDDAALAAFHRLAREEGVIPALETAHAFGYLEQHHDQLGEVVLLNVSGRGDKDIETVIEETQKRDLDVGPAMDLFRAVGSGGGHGDTAGKARGEEA